MKIWLSMIVLNEENRIMKSIWDIVDLFDDVVILDTWSTDNTINILHSIGVVAIHHEIKHEDKNRLIDARNRSIELNKCDWVLILDWDEIISREDVIKIKQFEPKCFASWYFVRWLDHRYDEPFEDYKMCIINKEKTRFLLSVHACPQAYIRDNNGIWLRMNWITLHHYPEKKNYRDKYINQIKDGILENPWCIRFYRFLWYTYYLRWQIKDALHYLYFVVDNIWLRFPVETLNSIMILSCIHQDNGDSINSFYFVALWLEYYDKVKHDFEVKVNFRLLDRFKKQHQILIENSESKLVPHKFAS